ncbi:class I SAM-dependent methyltransferase [Aurantimonas sp. Leaf443]|uniref:class I SAM-dependent methyltransferase n=1 Tax=Aurantimonas sp. Leaf443 TaxID=1736378 RepID=UPI00070087A2|nr:class I SAM-dependent methyltransferase [Aurantimonas sp. Leaf443]KQT85140.1 hypothetical protein ASG48_07630 [Aurantimonas sp. Leaf443]
MSARIHPDDDMFQGSRDHYESCGRQFADLIVAAAEKHGAASPAILELPCGYGRVTRHLVERFAPASITAADAMEPAVDFCVEEFGVTGVVVRPPLNGFNEVEDDRYDVAAMGSLVTHLGEADAIEVLANFGRKVAPSGIAIVTTHGVRAYDLLCKGTWHADQIDKTGLDSLKAAYEGDGFGFVRYRGDHVFERKTADSVGETYYGVSLIRREWLVNRMTENGFALDTMMEGGWDNHQDVFVFRKA